MANPLLFCRKNKKPRLWEAERQEGSDGPGSRLLEWAESGAGVWRCIRERLLATGASTEDQDLDKTVLFVPLGLTHALEKQKHQERSE